MRAHTHTHVCVAIVLRNLLRKNDDALSFVRQDERQGL